MSLVRSLITAFSAGLAPVAKEANLSAVPGSGGWYNILAETFSGSWQRVITSDSPPKLVLFSAVYAAVSMISGDISKCRPMVVEEDLNGIKTEVRNSPYAKVLRRPNRFQTLLKFFETWTVCKLLHGNMYALKVRDARGIVVELYILDPTRVTPLVADSGDIYYRLAADNLAGIEQAVVVPASDIIHDTMVCLWHPLVGVSPITACALSATQGNRIQADSTTFFQNMSRPSGLLTSEQKIEDADATRFKREWDENFQAGNVGKTAVLGSGLQYKSMAVTPQDAQLILQLDWTVRDVARAFGVPAYKIGGTIERGVSPEAYSLTYYTDCLQKIFEQTEAALDFGLGLPPGYSTEFDLSGLVRMDMKSRYEAKSIGVKGGWLAPNEARRGENYKPVVGGDSPMIQQQNFSLAALAKRDAREDPFASTSAKAEKSAGAGPVDSADGTDSADAAEAKRVALQEKLARELVWQA